MTAAQRSEPRWITAPAALAVHDRQLAEHGGPTGVRDAALLESALARPVNKWNYGEDDLAALAAAYAFGIARNQLFTDGNKRTAWVIARLFLNRNSTALEFAPHDPLATVRALAAGDLTEDKLADWFRGHLRAV